VDRIPTQVTSADEHAAVDGTGAKAAPPHRRRIPRFVPVVVAVLIAAALVYAAVLKGFFHSARQPAGTAATTIRSIAVLPLVNLSSDTEQEYFSDGMTDELITDLANSSNLLVISHTSVERYKQTQEPLRQIAQELGVDAVVEGRVLRSGQRVRISAQLIDARTDHHLWAQSYEGDLRDVLTLQDQVAKRIANEVGVTLTLAQPAALAGARNVDPDALEAYLKGNFYWNRLTCDGFQRAREQFQQAVDRDPNYALAYVGLAQAYFTQGDWDCVPASEAIPKSKAAVLRAIQLDPSLGAAHAWLGKIAFFYDWNWPEAEKQLNEAVELDPNYVYAHLIRAVFLVTRGTKEQGIAEMRKALALDPTGNLTNVVSTFVLYLAHEYDQAIEQGNKAVELYPTAPASYIFLAAAYERKGLAKEAMDAYLKEKSLEGLPGSDLDAYRKAYEKSGIAGYWGRELERTKTAGPVTPCAMASLYAHVAQKEKTLDFLSKGVQQHCGGGVQFLTVDPQYDFVRNEPRFAEIMRELRM
jgi:TolB-like protein/Tfp pilus assembly protein PilF